MKYVHRMTIDQKLEMLLKYSLSTPTGEQIKLSRHQAIELIVECIKHRKCCIFYSDPSAYDHGEYAKIITGEIHNESSGAYRHCNTPGTC